MDGPNFLSSGRDDLLDPPPRLYERLRQIAGYDWDETKLPFHSTYGFWHVSGKRRTSHRSLISTSPQHLSSPGSVTRTLSSGPPPGENHTPLDYAPSTSQDQNQHSSRHPSTDPSVSTPPASDTTNPIEEFVVARVSYHGLREERAFQITKAFTATGDSDNEHFVKPINLIRLAPAPGDRGVITVAIYEHPGENYLWDVLDMGPAFYKARREGNSYHTYRTSHFNLKAPISLDQFLNFAIGAAQCLEMLHHGQGIVHGEIRGDAFHFNLQENKVRVASFGSGIRSFEHGLTSTGWTTLNKELGSKNKLLYISPEQTGRMPAEPDSRTDIYSVGVLFWQLLTQKQVFEGETPIDIVQAVLGRRVPNVAEIRNDIPDVVGRIIQKCTAKIVTERYHSASGLKHDLVKVQEFLSEGNSTALNEWKIGGKDISSFFMLPNVMIGRQTERNDLLKVIDRVAKTHPATRKSPMSRFSDGSALSVDVPGMDDLSSSGASSMEGANRRSGSFTHNISSDPKAQRTNPNFHQSQQSLLSDNVTVSGDTMSSTQSVAPARPTRPWERQQSISMDTRSLVDSLDTNNNRQSMADSGTSLSRQLGSAKFRRRGHCEVVVIEGAGGLGKSCLVQSVLAEARRRGYCATAKFDTSRRTAFGPLLKLLSSLFKQVWGERDTSTPFHQGLKQYIRPVWPMLHKVLGLPEFLLGAPDASSVVARSISSSQGSASRGTVRSPEKQRGSISPERSPGPSSGKNPSIASQSSQDFLRAGASTKTMRLMNTFLDVLRVFTQHKFICFCLDDLHFADDESLELISQIMGARMKMAIVITHRPDELSNEKMQQILHPPESDEFPRASGGLKVTNISLSALSEEDIVQYVSATLSRTREEIMPLALVIQSKTAGNPFYIREMLSACHRKRCVWYDYRDSMWHFDLDRLFDQFKGEKDYDVLDTGFITRRLDELPLASRTMLAWAALLGNSFSFELICCLMSGEFEYDDESNGDCCSEKERRGYSHSEVVAGLQAALQAFIVVASETDDRFRFAHDRYVHAAADLKECSARRMHFIISQTLLKYPAHNSGQDNTALHICKAAEIIKRRVTYRRRFRTLLIDCAQSSTENGARPTAAKYYDTAISLLQQSPWSTGLDDADYHETIQLYLRSAECYLFMGQHQPAHDLLTIIFQNAKTAIDKAPAFVLQSRIFSQNGNAQAAVVSLKECLGALGVELEENPTYQSCDERFHRLRKQIQSMDRAALLSIDQGADPTLASIGAVLSETASAAWWSDCLRYYHLTLVILETHLHKGAFPQSGVAFLHLAVVTLARHNMTEFAVELGSVSQELLHSAKDSFSIARGLMLYPCLIGHTHNPMLASLNQMEDAVEIASSAGDRTSTILSYGLHALIKFFASENLTDLEAYCQYGCEEIPNWYYDTRGGAMLLAVRQVCRALSGKTRTREPQDVLSDELHNAPSYKNWLLGRTQHSNRSTLLYESLELVPLFLYGHYERAVEIGKQCVDNLPMLWSARNSRLILLIYGLSRTGQLLQKMQDPRNTAEDYQPQVDHVVRELKSFAQMTKDWATVSSVNYFIWYKLLEAQAAELTTDHGDCVEAYEEALDHAAEYNFVFEEALGNYLMAGFFLRRKARRSARAALMEALGLFRQFAATGVAMHIEEEHSLLLHGPTRNHRTAEAGVQTDFVSDAAPDPYRAGETDDVLSPGRINNLAELKGERTAAWGRSMNIQTEASEGLPTLDMIDLHAILHSSQVISSVLQIDDLLKKMCNVVLQTCGSSASLAAIVVHKSDENGLPQDDQWCVAASGDPEQGAQSHPDGLPISGDDLVVENVILFSTRFMESIFVSDLSSDERFSNVNDKWLRRNPLGRAVIAIPIVHGKDRDGKPALHGVLYLEGEPGSFTDRNVSVLQLLVMQLGISYSNAMAMGNINRVSVENEKMLRHQMELTGKAKTAEAAARHAEAEARKNVKLAEEAAKAKSIFLANVSHELRTPLNGVIGNSELLRDSQLNKEQLEMADSIRVSADLLLTVINDILDFSKMEADKMTLWMIAFNPEEMVREVVRAVSYSNREKTSKKNVKIIQNIDLPPMLIYGDPIRLHQVLGNLIGNSLKFTEDGSITIGARLESDTHEKATLTFWVRDTGIGIPPQQLRKLFQPFSQADASTARKYGGSGLGLSICKSLIEMMMKGHIKLESDEGKGTTASFTVAFDKTQPDVSAGEAQSKPPTSAEQRQAISEVTEEDSAPNPYLDLSGLSKSDVRICVAEDNPINQKIAIQYTQRLGYTNISAYDNGQKAVEGLRQKAKDGQPYHIILMDVQMPVLDGYEATKLLRKDPIEAVRKVLVIAMTASAIQGDREKCLAAGMNDYLAKPVRSEVLKRKLETYLNAQHSDGIESSKPAHDASTKQSEDGSTSVQVVQPPKPPAANQQPPQMTVEDPMRDGAVFNQPLDDQSLSAKEEPIMETTSSDSSTPTPASKDLPLRNASSTSLALSRTSTSSDSKTGLTTDNTMGQGPQKRQQRKLTKSRGDSETNLDKLNKDRPRPSINSDETLVDKTERPKGVLVKKDRHTKISTASVVDGDGPENKPPVGKEDTANVNGSAPTQSSSLEDGLFPN